MLKKKLIIKGIEFGDNFNSTQVTDMSYMFWGDQYLRNKYTTGIVYLGCAGLTTLDLSKLDTRNVTNMKSMFEDCVKLESLNFGDYKTLITSKVKNMEAMFCNCSSLKSLDVRGFDTGNVTTFFRMFRNCSELTELDVSGFDTSHAIYMSWMFAECSKLTKIDVSHFETGKVQNMNYMFCKCTGLTEIDTSNFRAVDLVDMGSLFSYCSGLESIDISSMAPSSKEVCLWDAFSGCSSLKELNLSGWQVREGERLRLETCTKLEKIVLNNFKTSSSLPLSSELFDKAQRKYYSEIPVGEFNCTLEKFDCDHPQKAKVIEDKNLKTKATCTKAAVYYYECAICQKKLNSTFSYGEALGHKALNTKAITPATTSKDGKIEISCSRCKAIIDTQVINRAYVTIANPTIAYNKGQAVKPTIAITDKNGKAISSKYYTITYKNNKKVGKATYKIVFKDRYSGTSSGSFIIAKKDLLPASVTGLKLTAASKSFKASWKPLDKNCTGYEIQYSTDKNFLGSDTAKLAVRKNTSKSATIKKLTSKKTYYVRIRAVGKDGNNKLTSAWSAAVKVKVK